MGNNRKRSVGKAVMPSPADRTTSPPPTCCRLREWRHDRGLTLADIADLVGRDVSVISRLERGEILLSPLARVALAKRLGVRVGRPFPVAR